MRLSEAIRLGAMMRPQAFGHYSLQHKGSCAMVAAAEVEGSEYRAYCDLINLAYNYAPLSCPACSHEARIFCGLVAHLNDNHRWTREAIADWVDSIEQQQARPEVAVEVEA